MSNSVQFYFVATANTENDSAPARCRLMHLGTITPGRIRACALQRISTSCARYWAHFGRVHTRDFKVFICWCAVFPCIYKCVSSTPITPFIHIEHTHICREIYMYTYAQRYKRTRTNTLCWSPARGFLELDAITRCTEIHGQSDCRSALSM